MSYDKMLNELHTEFNKYPDLFLDPKKYKHEKIWAVPSLPELKIKFPGYKTKGWKKDYAVTLKNTEYKHDIIAEHLYERAKRYTAEQVVLLKNFLFKLAENGYHIDLAEFPLPDPLLDQEELNFSLLQLQHLIPWIALQEDTNYPTFETGYSGLPLSGRRMSFYRYLEAVEAALPNPVITWDTVNALIRSKKRLTEQPGINYGILKHLQSPKP